jgi:hypothetical protein
MPEIGKFRYENIRISAQINTPGKNKQVNDSKPGKAGKERTKIQPVKMSESKP